MLAVHLPQHTPDIMMIGGRSSHAPVSPPAAPLERTSRTRTFVSREGHDGLHTRERAEYAWEYAGHGDRLAAVSSCFTPFLCSALVSATDKVTFLPADAVVSAVPMMLEV